MKIIGIDSSGLSASVAILEDDKLVSEYFINHKKTHSQTLLPMLDEISRMSELDLSTVDAIAISKGPGSFTGLRIGSATAKGLGLALNIPIVEVSTTAGMAYNFCYSDRLICPIMDARRSQVYTGLYEFTDGELKTLLTDTAEPIESTIERVNGCGRPVIFMGDGVAVFKETIEKECKVSFSFAPAHLCMQRASSIAVYGMSLYKEGKIVSAKDHAPEYLRLSQAERERNEAINGH